MRRLAALSLVLLFAMAVAQQAGSFASLVITPAGDEEFDIATGITTLLDGGVITDHDSGITLESPWIRYKVGEFIETTDTSVRGSFGAVSAASVHVDIQAALLNAEGELQLDGRNLTVTGDTLRYFADAGVVDLEGQVVASSPVFSASRLLYDTDSGTVLLFGPYTFDDGFLELTATSASARLELRRPAEEPEDPEQFAFMVSSTPDPETLALFGNWLD